MFVKGATGGVLLFLRAFQLNFSEYVSSHIIVADLQYNLFSKSFLFMI